MVLSKKIRLEEELRRIQTETSGGLEFTYIPNFENETIAPLGEPFRFTSDSEVLVLLCKGIDPKRWRDNELDVPVVVYGNEIKDTITVVFPIVSIVAQARWREKTPALVIKNASSNVEYAFIDETTRIDPSLEREIWLKIRNTTFFYAKPYEPPSYSDNPWFDVFPR